MKAASNIISWLLLIALFGSNFYVSVAEGERVKTVVVLFVISLTSFFFAIVGSKNKFPDRYYSAFMGTFLAWIAYDIWSG